MMKTMKLNKANNDGTVSVTVPKQTAREMGWEAGQEVNLCSIDKAHLVITNNSTLLLKDGGYPTTYKCVPSIIRKLREAADGMEGIYKQLNIVNNELPEGLLPMDIEATMRKTISITLVDIIDRLGV